MMATAMKLAMAAPVMPSDPGTNRLKDEAGDAEHQEGHDIDGEDAPAVTLRQRMAASKALHRPEPFHHAGRNGDQEHGEEYQAGQDEEKKPDENDDAGRNRRRQDGKKPGEAALDGGREI